MQHTRRSTLEQPKVITGTMVLRAPLGGIRTTSSENGLFEELELFAANAICTASI